MVYNKKKIHRITSITQIPRYFPYQFAQTRKIFERSLVFTILLLYNSISLYRNILFISTTKSRITREVSFLFAKDKKNKKLVFIGPPRHVWLFQARYRERLFRRHGFNFASISQILNQFFFSTLIPSSLLRVTFLDRLN